ncbi:P-loop containing nucleoside triphosphate hydrolase protein [Hypoxylon sp. NC1633]|nr:P-loop containing nucleoside triphosphate hydrolase protein [Hypoxylon sp. NC1633]
MWLTRALTTTIWFLSKSTTAIEEPGLGPDFPPVLDRITNSLDPSRFVYLNDFNEIDSICPVDYHGNLPCHAGPETSFVRLSKPKAPPPAIEVADAEKSAAVSGRPDVEAETARVATSESDLLRALHVSKNFGSNVAVEDVSLGLREGEILALLGPNGAGKTTMINMIRGDLTPSSGRIYLEGVDVLRNTWLPQKHLGVCPQSDALDLLTVREHLTLYTRSKGVPNNRRIPHTHPHRPNRSRLQTRTQALRRQQAQAKPRHRDGRRSAAPDLILDEPSSAMDAASKRVLWHTLLRNVAPRPLRPAVEALHARGGRPRPPRGDPGSHRAGAWGPGRA